MRNIRAVLCNFCIYGIHGNVGTPTWLDYNIAIQKPSHPSFRQCRILTTSLLYDIYRNMHIKCVNEYYPLTDQKVNRGSVPEDKIEWKEEYADYQPLKYTASVILAYPSFADPGLSDPDFKPKWNSLDGKVNRKSHTATYEVINGYPRNYSGRTGITGRGCLGRWGPNHAADPVVTRWKLENGEFVVDETSGKKILQFVSIKRRDCGLWAIPGGMVDPGENVSATLKREFMEEALNSHEMTDAQKLAAADELKQLFSTGVEVYSGYVDDPRNTDNAWMETVAYNFHEDSINGLMYKLTLNAGDDAKAVKWSDMSRDLPLYASHEDIIEKVAKRHDAHW